MTPIHNNSLVYGHESYLLERLIIYLCYSYWFVLNKTELYYGHTVIRCYTGIVVKIQLPYVSKFYDHTDTDGQMCWKIVFKLPQNVTPMWNDWPEKNLI